MERIRKLGKETKEERYKRLLGIAEEEVRWPHCVHAVLCLSNLS